jgi:hypothetical protein
VSNNIAGEVLPRITSPIPWADTEAGVRPTAASPPISPLGREFAYEKHFGRASGCGSNWAPSTAATDTSNYEGKS